MGEYRCPLSGLLWRGVNGDTWEPGRPQKQGMLPNIGSWCVTCVGHRSGTESSHVTVRLASHMPLVLSVWCTHLPHHLLEDCLSLYVRVEGFRVLIGAVASPGFTLPPICVHPGVCNTWGV